MATILLKRGTRAQLEAAALAGQLIVGEPYLITDESRVAVGTSATTYDETGRYAEVAGVAQEETLRDLSVDLDDLIVRALLRKLMQLKYDSSSNLSVAVASLPTLATVTTLTTGNVGIGDAGKPVSYQQVSAMTGYDNRNCFVWE